MPSIASGIIALWPGTAASLPANWSRATTLDSRYPRGVAAGGTPGLGGGNATHTHSDPSGHSHTDGGHAHTASALIGGSVGLLGVAGSTSVASGAHGHSGATFPSATIVVAGNASWAAASSEPANYTVIWTQSNGTPAGFAANMGVLWYQTVLPAGWTHLSGSAGNFLRGAATGADGGLPGSPQPHNHSDAHTHTATHGHGVVASGGQSGSNSITTGTGTALAGAGHTHDFAGSAYTAASAAAAASTAGVTPYEPPYSTLTVITNSSGAVSFPAYAICLWLGSLAAIPAGFSLCDGTGGTPDLRTLFVKASANLTDIGTTGGTLGHSHTAPAVGHTHDYTHSHAGSYGVETSGSALTAPSGTLADSTSHSHSGGAISSTTVTLAAAVSSLAPIVDSRPPYTDVAFIMYTAAPQPTISSPANNAVESLPSFAVTWSYAVLRIQITYRLFVYDSTGTVVIYDSLPQRSSALTATIPAGYLQDNTTYKVGVVISDSGNQSASSPLVTFSTNWSAPPTPGSVTAAPIGGS